MAAIHITPPLESYRIIHPLDDVAETKCSTTGLGPIKMTPAVRLSLTALRGYLVLITLMLVYHVIDLAGWLPHTR
ncbi:hypothetical protein [Granulicella paludicola]|uniref:hypothetical protein n=1 Tax=Granulicella paludicola TaxID=474951 RepID=UPI0021E0A0BA|nr:hypothetical protein [Granulicella paludicola]